MKLLKISIIIRCLNESEHLSSTLDLLQGARKRGHEIILCDGGSTDNTIEISNRLVDHCILSPPGRSLQMNNAAKHASGDALCFLHADTFPPENIDTLITDALNNTNKVWGRFNIKLSSPHWPYRFIEFLMNLRSCFSGIATGDQGIFICRNIFFKLSGYADIPLMEDIEISKRLLKISKPLCIKKNKLITSSRRWEQHGIIRTVLLMWQLRLRFFIGTPASTLARSYRANENAK